MIPSAAGGSPLGVHLIRDVGLVFFSRPTHMRTVGLVPSMRTSVLCLVFAGVPSAHCQIVLVPALTTFTRWPDGSCTHHTHTRVGFCLVVPNTHIRALAALCLYPTHI